jgi:hypothetical protein
MITEKNIKNCSRELYCKHCGKIIKTNNLFISQEIKRLPSHNEVTTIITCDKYECYSDYQ